ncbi:MarR family transcriptional regulator [Altererythrobacter confluentis]|uniref:MarR family transcriptional regulator n=1 Tax=Allopontixanthobacter confluentis TaxID=1849021 RepID=A0A6L7GFQ3_9SPHN|nr:MarR family transcriptional regulator [Allopontixanthobacter confluentis]MXP14345.1 MarR family transcriptional regulator [Allopontixanthobacter confluentis]
MANIGYLMADNSRQLRRAFDQRVRALGVTGPQARLLLMLDREGGQNQGFYADRLDVEAITLCRMVDRLEEAGLVERRRDPADRRAWNLHLTPKADAQVSRLAGHIGEMVEEALTGMDDADRAEFTRMLTLIGSNLSARRDFKDAANG